MRKKRIILMVTIILAVILLFPIKYSYSDSRNVDYKAIVYTVKIISEDSYAAGRYVGVREGFIVEIFGVTVFGRISGIK